MLLETSPPSTSIEELLAKTMLLTKLLLKMSKWSIFEINSFSLKEDETAHEGPITKILLFLIKAFSLILL